MNLRILLLAGLLLSACTHTPARCGYPDFAPRPYDHIIESIGPFEATSFRGHVSSKDILGPWAAQLEGQFEIHGPDGFVTTVPVGEGGGFEYDLQPGVYCFKISAIGFRSMLGTVTLSPRAGGQPIAISMIISE